MGEGFTQVFIGLLQLHIFSHQGDGHLILGVLDGIDHRLPSAKVRRMTIQPQTAHNKVVEPIRVQL